MKFSLVVVLGLMVAVSTAMAGPKLKIGDNEDAWLKPSFLGQANARFNDNAVDSEDFYLRRARIILAGQMQDGIKFFMETDNDNAGKSGAATASMDVQDAFIDVRLLDYKDNGVVDMWVEGGLVLLPFSFENKSSAASLLGIDYNSETIKFVNSFVWRDYGAELHGHVKEVVEYRVGIFDGYDSIGSTKNPGAPLRYTGHVAVNLIGKLANGGWFYSQNRLGHKVDGKMQNYLIVGAGIDSQADASTNVTAGVVKEIDNDALVADLQSSFAMGPVALLVNAAYYDWDNAAFVGNTAFAEAGLLIAGDIMPTVKWSLQDPDSGTAIEDVTVGLHYFIKGQNARVGVEYTWGDSASTDEQLLLGIQFLL